MERIQIKNLIDSYTKKLFKLKKAYLSSEIKLPRLTPSHSYKDLLQRKIEKLKALNSRFRNNSGERKVKAELSNLFQVQHVKNEYLKRILHMKNKENNNMRKYNFEINSLSDNSHNTFNSITNNSISKTNVSNNGNNNNKVKIVKIKNVENSKNIQNDISILKDKIINKNEDNNFCFLKKKKYYIKKNNINKDICKLINSDNNIYFFSKFTNTPKNDVINSFINENEINIS